MDEQEMIRFLRSELYQAMERDPELRAALKHIEAGKGTFKDTAQYSERTSELLGQILSKHVDELPEGMREAVCNAMLRERYEEVNGVCAEVQEMLDEPLGIRLQPQRAPYPAERVQQVAHALEDPTVALSVIQRRARAPVANVSKSFHDDYMKKNADVRSRLGFKCYLNRVAATGCCKWCTDIAGRYVYGDHPDEVFHRHDNCGCTVTYENGRERQDVWSKRKWQADPAEVERQAKEPTVFSPDEAEDINNLLMIQEQGYKISKKPNKNAYSVDRNFVNSKGFHDKFDGLTPRKPANESLCQQSRRLLEARDGTDNEGLIIIDARTGKLVTDNLEDKAGALRTGLTSEEYELVKDNAGKVIMLHNHPDGSAPSGRDILTYWAEEKADSSVVVGHDGTVYILSEINREIPLDKIYEEAYNRSIENGFPKSYAKVIAANALYDSGAFSFVKR